MDDKNDPDQRPVYSEHSLNESSYQYDTEPDQISWQRPLILFACTVLTTLISGTLMKIPSVGVIFLMFSTPSILLEGVPFSLSILSILMAHEMGHYLYGRWYQVHTSLPYFLPSPLFLLALYPGIFIALNPGTFGAVIVSRGLYPNRQALMDIGAAGPIAGFLVAIPIMAYSLTISRVAPIPDGPGGIYLGEPLIFQILAYLIHGPLPEDYTIYLDPIGLAAWFGCLVTMLNLLPIGQLDGGHILYAFTGSNESARQLQKYLMSGCFITLAILGIYSPGLWFFGILLLVMMRFFGGFKHPVPVDDYAPLPPHSKAFGIIAIIVLVLTFMPVPIDVNYP